MVDSWKTLIELGKKKMNSQTIPKELINLSPLPIKIQYSILNKIWNDFYTYFLNINPTSLEVILDSKNQVLKSILNISKKNDLYLDSISVKIPENYDFAEIDLNYQEIYEKLEKYIKKEYNHDLGNIHLIRNSFLIKSQEILSLNRSKNTLSIKTLLYLFQLFLQAFNKQEIIIYPVPSIIQFLKAISKIFQNFNVEDLLKFIEKYLPSSPVLLFFTKNNYFFNISLKKNKRNIWNITLNENYEHYQPLFHQKTLYELKTNFNSFLSSKNFNFIINIENFTHLLDEILQFDYPLQNLQDFEYILKNILLFYREYESSWISYPQPLRYNDRLRFWLYTFGFHNNFKKLSYWALPSLLSNFFTLNFGLDYKWLFILSKNRKSLKDDILKQQLTCISMNVKNGLISQVKNETQENIQSALNQAVVFLESQEKSSFSLEIFRKLLAIIRKGYSLQNQYISHCIWLSEDFLKKSIYKFLLSHKKRKLPLISLYIWLKTLKNPKKFMLYPEPQLYSKFKSSWTVSNLRDLGFMFTDQNEF